MTRVGKRSSHQHLLFYYYLLLLLLCLLCVYICVKHSSLACLLDTRWNRLEELKQGFTNLQVKSRSPRQSSSHAWRLATRRRRLATASNSKPWTRSKLHARLQMVLAPTASARLVGCLWGLNGLLWPPATPPDGLMRRAPRPSVTDSAVSDDGVMRKQFFWT